MGIHTKECFCVAENPMGNVPCCIKLKCANLLKKNYLALKVCPIVLIIPVPPQIHYFDFGDESIYASELVTSTCTVSKGDYPIEISWFLNGHPINEIHGINVVQTNRRVSQLTIESLKPYILENILALLRILREQPNIRPI